MNTVDVLRRAKEILSDPTRWCRGGGFEDRMGAYCAVGAIAHVRGVPASDMVDRDAAVKALASTVKAMRGYELCLDWRGVAVWNDHDATHAELIDAFDRAILSLTDEQSQAEQVQRQTVAA